ncbi:MAG: hypothetical protein QOG85_197 [Gaiellaceae bacterium]|nr:hypothetical protein [Gaiellaceae bacterium]
MWDWAVWGALLVAICSGIAGIVLAAVRAREALRSIKGARSRTVDILDALEARAELVAVKAESATATHELQQSVIRLRTSLARLAILRDATAEVETRLWWVRVLL